MARRHREDWRGERARARIVIPSWETLSGNDQGTFRAVATFLNNRLAESDTIEWALQLKPDQRIERFAVVHLLNRPSGLGLKEPWASAWRLIEESWSHNLVDEGLPRDIDHIQRRLRAGDRSGMIVSAIVSLVAPGVKVESINSPLWRFVKRPRRPKTFHHLLLASLTSGDFVGLDDLELDQFKEVSFLMALANALEAAVNRGLDIARRIGWRGEPELLQLGSLHRVDILSEVDVYSHGIAPAVILLHTVVARIAELEPDSAQPFVQRWRLEKSPVHVRLWAATALNPFLVSAEKVGTFFNGLNDYQFWDFENFPEIAKLRAVRFTEIDHETQRAITTRLCKLPPRNYWPRKADAEKIKYYNLYSAVQELGRIEVAGGDFPPDTRSWLEANIGQFPELTEMEIDKGLPEKQEASYVPLNPDDRYDTLQGLARLRTLERALLTERDSWYDGPAARARDWLRQLNKTTLVLGDLEATGDGGDKFPSVWNCFGRVHASERPRLEADDPPGDLQDEVERILRLLEKLSDKTLSAAIEGISDWLFSWQEQVIASPLILRVWLRVWPFAVEMTNNNQQSKDDVDLSVLPRASDDDQAFMDPDTLNTPLGKLVVVFLSGCPSLEEVPDPFSAGTVPRQMRDAVIRASGQSGWIARHGLIKELPYFLKADADWTQEHLITPLSKDDDELLILWRAVARRLHFTEVLKIIGGTMAEKATDRRLGRKTQRNLVFSLVVESLHAFREAREPAVPNPRIQQMLRRLDGEGRAAAADAIQKFVQELSGKEGNDNASLQTAESLFRSSVAPFLKHVWPQERSLVTPGVSLALAKLPTISGEAFDKAVEAIERFLVPCECWSMFDYGFYDYDGAGRNFSIISDRIKAKAFLQLLDLTVGPSESAVIPRDLADALDQIQSVAPAFVDSPEFRRLSATARR